MVGKEKLSLYLFTFFFIFLVSYLFYFYILDERMKIGLFKENSEGAEIVVSSPERIFFFYNDHDLLKDCFRYDSFQYWMCKIMVRNQSISPHYSLLNVLEKNKRCSELREFSDIFGNLTRVCLTVRNTPLIQNASEFESFLLKPRKNKIYCGNIEEKNLTLYRLCNKIKNLTGRLSDSEFRDYIHVQSYLLNSREAHTTQSYYSCYNKSEDYLLFFKIADCISEFEEAQRDIKEINLWARVLNRIKKKKLFSTSK